VYSPSGVFRFWFGYLGGYAVFFSISNPQLLVIPRSNLRWYLATHAVKFLPLILLLACGIFVAITYFFDSINNLNPFARLEAKAKATIEAQVNLQVSPIDIAVSELRGTTFNPVYVNIVKPKEIGNVFEELSRYEKKELFNNYKAMLVSFNFISSDFDMESYMTRDDNLGLLGYYLPYYGEIFIVSEEYEFGQAEELVYAHEAVHAIQDQTFGLPEEYDLQRKLLSFEGDLPYLALVEGEATFVEQQFLNSNYFDERDRENILVELNTFTPEQQEKLEKIPHALINGSQFPYHLGTEFVQTLYESGGWQMINKAWENPPRSTEQIIHPEKYFEGETAQAVLIPFPGQPWKSIDTGVLGEFYLREYLSQQIPTEQVIIAATGWGGDAYKILSRRQQGEDDYALIYHTVWDTKQDHQEFLQAYIQYAGNYYNANSKTISDNTCWANEDATCIFDNEEQIIIVRASDLDTAIELMSTQKN